MIYIGIESPITSFPISLHPLENPPMSDASRVRAKSFLQSVFLNANGPLFSIDNALMDTAVVNDVVMMDSTEVWTLQSQTGTAHPWHIHDIHFRVTEVIDGDGNPLNPEDYAEIFKGPKDNVLVQPGWKLSYITND